MKILQVFTLTSTAKSFFDGQFKYLSDFGYDIHLATNDCEESDFTQRNDLTCHQIQIERRISPLSDLKSIRNLRSLIRHEQYDAVIGHTPKGAMVAMFAAKLAGVKTRIYYRHGLIYTTATGLKRFILKTVEQLTAACATAIVNVSSSLNELAVKDHLNPNKKQHVIGSGTCGGIDTIDIFNPAKVSADTVLALRHTHGIPEGAFVVGFCGRLCRDKGIVELIEGFKLFHGTHPNLETRLLLVGPYDARDILPQYIKDEIESTPYIIAPGLVSHHFLPNYYSVMDVFVFPSYREGFGMSVIEASAMEIPILTTRSHGCIDTIQEGVTGEYIDLSSEGIASGLEKIIAESKRTIYGKQGRQWVSENFDQRILWPKIKDFYNTLSNNNSIGI